jgi:hypothetical protein
MWSGLMMAVVRKQPSIKGWVKLANKIGRYSRSYEGFRIYCTKEPEIKQSIEERSDGTWRRTEFIKGWFVAIDKYGCRFEASSVDQLAFKIDIENFARKFKD